MTGQKEFTALSPNSFLEDCNLLLEKCKAQGYDCRIIHTTRTPEQQARLWRQGRSKERIKEKINWLKAQKCDYLAYVLQSVGPQYGHYVTKALPGASWHQWGEAVDFMMLTPLGEAIWDGGFEGYQFLGIAAEEMGYTSGFFWKMKDSGHIQKRRWLPPYYFQWEQINAEMVKRFKKDEL